MSTDCAFKQLVLVMPLGIVDFCLFIFGLLCG